MTQLGQLFGVSAFTFLDVWLGNCQAPNDSEKPLCWSSCLLIQIWKSISQSLGPPMTTASCFDHIFESLTSAVSGAV